MHTPPSGEDSLLKGAIEGCQVLHPTLASFVWSD